jgi:hypothetical protein
MVTQPEDRLKLAGTVVAEKYAIERVLREDEFVIDYAATQLIARRSVIVRVLAGLAQVEGHTRSHLYNDYLMDQAKLVELLPTAPALRLIRDAGTLPSAVGDWLAFVVEDIPQGRPLSTVLKERRLRGSTYTLPEAVGILDPIAVALAIAHDARLVHGRVSEDDVWVLDHGVALHNFALPRLSARARELSQIPIDAADPLESRGGTTPQCDVLGLASLLTQMCGSKSGMNAAASAVIARAKDGSPAKRWRNEGEFWVALRRALDLPPLRGLTKTIPPDVVPDAPGQTSLQRARLLIMSVTLLLVGIALGVLRTSCWPQASQQNPGQGAVPSP